MKKKNRSVTSLLHTWERASRTLHFRQRSSLNNPEIHADCSNAKIRNSSLPSQSPAPHYQPPPTSDPFSLHLDSPGIQDLDEGEAGLNGYLPAGGPDTAHLSHPTDCHEPWPGTPNSPIHRTIHPTWHSGLRYVRFVHASPSCRTRAKRHNTNLR